MSLIAKTFLTSRQIAFTVCAIVGLLAGFGNSAGHSQSSAQPGAKLEIPKIPPATFEAVARGKVVYATLCSKCHGPEGKGDGPQVKDLKNDDGTPMRTPRTSPVRPAA